MKKSVLFVCIHNSARSQMAEELLRKYGGDLFETESAGIEPGKINQNVAKVLKEDEGIDIFNKKTNSVMDFHKEGRTYDYVVAVCGKEAEEKCPIFPGKSERLHWPFDDPSQFKGSEEEVLAGVRTVKKQIEDKIKAFVDTFK